MPLLDQQLFLLSLFPNIVKGEGRVSKNTDESNFRNELKDDGEDGPVP
jgi:hypothetical protein